MPSKSDKQHRLMEAVKHNPKFAKKVGISQKVGRDFVAADKRTGKYAYGGRVGGVLGSLVGRTMPSRMQTGIPDRHMNIPETSALLGNADRTMLGVGNRLGALARRAKGGRT